MKTNMRGSLIQTCLLTATLLALPAVVQAQFIYITNNGTITITGYIGSGNVTIPNTIGGLPVTSIGDYAFSDTAVNSVTILSNVSTIGAKAFEWCHPLTAINVDAANSSYGSVNGVLFDKSQTTLIRYPEGVVGSYTIPSGVVHIGDNAFYECTSLTSVTISDSVTSIGDSAFVQCFGLDKVMIPNNVTNIGNYAFYATGLTNITIGNSVARIGDYAFFGCTWLTSVTIPDSVTSIGDWAFEGCESMTNVTFGNSVISIGDDAFNFCTGLTTVTIPRNVSTIGDEAFVYCYTLTAINVDATNLFFSSAAGVLFDKSQTTLVEYPAGKAGNNYIIPAGITSIGDYAFENCGDLTNITIGNSITNIGEYAFSECSLTSVAIPNSVISIGDGVFNGCENLTSVTIGSSVNSIGDNAFSECGNLFNVMIPNSVTNIGEGAFDGCGSLTNVAIGSGVTNIGSAFVQCSYLISVFFTGNAPSVDPSAFIIYGPGYSVLEAATVYYLPSTSGWSNTFAGLPTALWLPQVQTGDASFGVRTNQFGFNINWTSDQTVVVEACTNLANSLWQPVQTNTLTSDSVYFSDPQWANYPARFYRLRSP
jgi:hypothetical protein